VRGCGTRSSFAIPLLDSLVRIRGTPQAERRVVSERVANSNRASLH